MFLEVWGCFRGHGGGEGDAGGVGQRRRWSFGEGQWEVLNIGVGFGVSKGVC